MDSNNQNPQGDNSEVKKLEQDLQNLTQQAAATPRQPMPEEQPVQSFPQVPEVPPAISATPTTPVVPVETSAFVPESPKKGSPLMVIAIILGIVAVLAVVVYVFGAKYFTSGSKPTACTQEAMICPDGSSVGRTGLNCEFAPCPTASATPIETLMTTATPSSTPTFSLSASASANPTSTPTSSPSATP